MINILQHDIATTVSHARDGLFLLNEQKNVLRKQRHWERQLAAKKSKRKEEKQRRRLNRSQEAGKDGI